MINLNLLGTYPDIVESGYNSLVVQNGYAYLCGESGKFETVNILDPEAPTYSSVLTDLPTCTPMHLTLQGEFGFLACMDFGLIIVSLDNPAAQEN